VRDASMGKCEHLRRPRRKRNSADTLSGTKLRNAARVLFIICASILETTYLKVHRNAAYSIR